MPNDKQKPRYSDTYPEFEKHIDAQLGITRNGKKHWIERIPLSLIAWGSFVALALVFAVPYLLLTGSIDKKVPTTSQQSTNTQSVGCGYEGCREDENEQAQYEYYKTKHEGDSTGQCVIKGNVSYTTGERIYHLPSDPDYAATTIDPNYGERWFCSEQEAQSAGWRHAANQ